MQKNYWWEEDTTLKTALENDLGITGDDAVHLLVQAEEKFGVDWQALNFTRYFTPEGADVNPIKLWFNLSLLALLLTFFSEQLLLAYSSGLSPRSKPSG